MADEPEFRYYLKGFTPIKGEEKGKRRQINVETGEIISRRQFEARAIKRAYKPPKPKATPTIRQRRAKWYANHVNRQAWIRSAPQDAYISYAEAMESADFQMYERFIRSTDRDIREIGYNYFDELEWEYDNVDWGDTP